VLAEVVRKPRSADRGRVRAVEQGRESAGGVAARRFEFPDFGAKVGEMAAAVHGGGAGKFEDAEAGEVWGVHGMGG
jgi:hypothetical protein